MDIPSAVYLYNEGTKDINFSALEEFIRQTFAGLKVCSVKLKKKVVQRRGLLFDFLATQKSFAATRYAKIKNACQIIITPQLVATFDEQNNVHIRPAIFSRPSVISTSGIVEGPAKPREYYLYKQRYARLGLWEIEEPRLKNKFKARFIDYGDKRINAVLKGYLAQAMFFYITGNPFCKHKNCRLYNAHWQEDLIFAQITNAKFCPFHRGRFPLWLPLENK